MRLYLAAPYAARDDIRELAPVFEGAGHELTCEWLKGTRAIGDGTVGVASDHDDQTVAQHAADDLLQVDAADVLVLFSDAWCLATNPTLDVERHQFRSGGRHVETGYAIAQHKDIVVVGEAQNVFQRGLFGQVDNIGELLEWLDETAGR